VAKSVAAPQAEYILRPKRIVGFLMIFYTNEGILKLKKNLNIICWLLAELEDVDRASDHVTLL
jgi:hypothetical protein